MRIMFPEFGPASLRDQGPGVCFGFMMAVSVFMLPLYAYR
jgi:hypothetical protein